MDRSYIRQLVKNCPDHIKPAFMRCYEYYRGVLTLAEFRWAVFQYINDGNVAPLADYLQDATFWENPMNFLGTLLDDDEWQVAPFQLYRSDTSDEEKQAYLARHRAGMACVRDYLASH